MRGLMCVAVLSGLVAGCSSSGSSEMPVASHRSTSADWISPSRAGGAHSNTAALTNPIELPSTRPTVIGSILLSGQVKHAGQHDLCGGEKISDILRTSAVSVPASKLTVVLVRRCPEGTTSEMIDIDQNLAVLDARRDYALRDGDELVVSVAPSMPEGLSRPIAADVPPMH